MNKMNHENLLNSFKINPLGDLRSSKTFKIDDFMRHFNPIMLFLQICHETPCHIFCAPVLVFPLWAPDKESVDAMMRPSPDPIKH